MTRLPLPPSPATELIELDDVALVSRAWESIPDEGENFFILDEIFKRFAPEAYVAEHRRKLVELGGYDVEWEMADITRSVAEAQRRRRALAV